MAEILAKIATTPNDVQGSHGRRIVAKSGSEYFLLNSNDVLAFQAEGELVWIITAKHRFLEAQSLRTVEMRLEKSRFQSASKRDRERQPSSQDEPHDQPALASDSHQSATAHGQQTAGPQYPHHSAVLISGGCILTR